MSVPRGIRNHNPTNIRIGDSWLGAVGDDGDFVKFRSPEYGIRAAARILQTYQTTHQLKTIREIISRWAPVGDGANDPAEYARAVAIWMGREPDDAVDVYDYSTAYMLLRAMVRFECGPPPDERWYDEEVYEAGLRMAGVVRQKSLKDSRVIKGTATAAAGIASAQAILTDLVGLPPEIAAMLPAALSSLSEQAVAGIVLVIGLAGAGYAMWARRDDSLRGRL